MIKTGRCLASKVRPVTSRADDPESTGTVALGGQSQLPADGLVHIHDVAGGQRYVEDPVEAGVQGGGDLAADGGFARAGLAGEERDGAQLQEMAQPRLGLG